MKTKNMRTRRTKKEKKAKKRKKNKVAWTHLFRGCLVVDALHVSRVYRVVLAVELALFQLGIIFLQIVASQVACSHTNVCTGAREINTLRWASAFSKPKTKKLKKNLYECETKKKPKNKKTTRVSFIISTVRHTHLRFSISPRLRPCPA